MPTPSQPSPNNDGSEDSSNRNGAPTRVQIILNLFILYMAYRYFFAGSGSSTNESQSANTDMATDTHHIEQTPTPKPISSNPLETVFGDVFQGRKLTEELETYDWPRKRELMKFEQGDKLFNLWYPGQQFDLYVYLSTSAAPIQKFPDDKEHMEPASRSDGYDYPATGLGTQTGISWWFIGRDWSSPLSLLSGSDDSDAGSMSITGFIGSKLWGLFGSTDENSTDKREEAELKAKKMSGGSVETAIRWTHLSCPSNPSVDTPQTSSDQSEIIDNPAALVWLQKGLTFDWEETNERHLFVNVSLPDCVRKGNTSVYAHIYAVTAGAAPDPSNLKYRPDLVASFVHPLIRYMPKPKVRVERSLLSSEDESDSSTKERSLLHELFGLSQNDSETSVKNTKSVDSTDSNPTQPPERAQTENTQSTVASVESTASEPQSESQHDAFVPFWKPLVQAHMLHDFSVLPIGRMPPFYGDLIHGVHPSTLESFLDQPGRSRSTPFGAPVLSQKAIKNGGYLPILYSNDFWLLQENMYAVNETLTEAPLELSYTTMSQWKWQIQIQMQNSWDMQTEWGATGEGDTDEIKRMILETNPVLLGVTFVVSMLHMVFDMLAFKNDISFWRNTKSMAGLSLRTVAINCFFQLVILLYLWDNDTSWMVLISSAFGLIIEVWKLRKAITVGISWPNGKILPKITWENKDEQYVKSKTKEYDDIAMEHLSYIIYPLVIGYAIYSLFYGKHRGWYSWIISSLTGFVYAFGFILMTPQLFINYKLKSVAHLPWRALVYKSLNTFVDDLFAFVIRMPIMHRLSCFRDDIIFFIYLYQRWIYPVDKSRRNEFGASAEDYEMMEARKRGEKRISRRSKFSRRNDAGETITTTPIVNSPMVNATMSSSNSSKQASNSSKQTSDSSKQASNSSKQTGNPSKQTSNSSKQTSNSSKQASKNTTKTQENQTMSSNNQTNEKTTNTLRKRHTTNTAT